MSNHRLVSLVRKIQYFDENGAPSEMFVDEALSFLFNRT